MLLLAAAAAALTVIVLTLAVQTVVLVFDGFVRAAPAGVAGARPIPLPERSEWVRDARHLARILGAARFDLAAVRAGAASVPRLYVTALPPDFAALAAPAERKAVFIRVALPLVLRVNETIRDDRLRVRALARKEAAGVPATYAEAQWLQDLARRYRVDGVDLHELLLRVDEIPPSLALAQAAVESGWGTSRIARAGNALFGQKVWDGRGVAPLAPPQDGDFRYAAFDRLVDCIAAYARNLNTHPAYAAFREVRAAMRERHDDLDGLVLSAALAPYSTRGAAYVSDLQMLIYDNTLWAYDGARLDATAPARLLIPAI
ncbi:MAG: glucosaminidase domain-containing protein [Rhodospirillaceae bacterium]|nr:glucosaminidase domain-containing protein [Rhodospirillaceae bacterium]